MNIFEMNDAAQVTFYYNQ